MHTTCFNQHWSSSGVSKIADETAVSVHKFSFWGMPLSMHSCVLWWWVVPVIVSCVAVITDTHDTIRGTTHNSYTRHNKRSQFGTSATIWPIVPAPDDIWWWVWSSGWNEIWQGKLKYLEKTCPSATLSTTSLTWPDLGPNPGCCGGKLAADHLSSGTA
jgi:hypothetical protein